MITSKALTFSGTSQRGSRPRRGSLVIEVTIATLVLMVAMGLTVRVLGWVGQERRSSERRQWAVLEVANAMERITAHDFDRVNTALAEEVTRNRAAGNALPDGEWKAEVVETRGGAGVPSKRVVLSLRWKNRKREWEAPVRLTTWIERRRAPL